MNIDKKEGDNTIFLFKVTYVLMSAVLLIFLIIPLNNIPWKG